MNNSDLREFLTGQRDPRETAIWLQTEFLPEIRVHLNSENVRRRLGIYSGEKIPENERNLTDVRNRISLVLEYELARIATRLLEDAGIHDLFWTYVVANRFPDLEVRDQEGKRGLRIEVKCLQTISEEKSANFDTLRKDVHPKTDYLAVFMWEWAYDPGQVAWDRAPFVQGCYAFHATSLVQLRDAYWLNRPPSDLGGGLQGFDLRFGVNCVGGVYHEEEGNYGKLMRLWQSDFPHRPARTPLLDKTEQDYAVFKRFAVTSGFESLARILLPILSKSPQVVAAPMAPAHAVFVSGIFAFVLRSQIPKDTDLELIVAASAVVRVFVFSDKYSWTEQRLTEKDNGKKGKAAKTKLCLVKVRNGTKPKHLLQVGLTEN